MQSLSKPPFTSAKGAARAVQQDEEEIAPRSVLREILSEDEMSTYPEQYRYTKEHEWVNIEGDTGTIGITFHAQEQLGDIVYVDLPKTGTKIEKGKTMGSVESVKAVSDIYSPVSGEVISVNEMLSTTPEELNKDPHGKAWLVKIKLSAPNETEGLMTAADYEKYAGAE
jgi:glycine cleavage system H protein